MGSDGGSAGVLRDFFRQFLRCMPSIAGFAALLATMNFLFWGGAFSVAASHPYTSPHIFVYFSIPSALALGLGLALESLLPTANRMPDRAEVLAAPCMFAGLALLSFLLSLPNAMPALLVMAACLVGLGLGLGFYAWEREFARLGQAYATTVVGGACLAFPLFALAVRGLPTTAAYVLASLLICIAGVVPAYKQAICQAEGALHAEEPGEHVEPRPLVRLCATLTGYETEVASFGALGFIAGFSRVTSLGGGANTAGVAAGSFVGMAVVGILVLVRWHCFGKAFTPTSYYRLAFPAAATGFVLFTVLNLGFVSAFAWFADFFFEFMLVVATIDGARARADSVRAFCLATGTGFLMVAVGTVLGWVAQTHVASNVAVFMIAAVVCVYALAMPLSLQLRSRNASDMAGAEANAEGDGSEHTSQTTACFEATAARYGLTPREHEVMALTWEGLDSPTIAERLGLSDNTVRTHKKSLYRKLDIHSKAELVRIVQEADKSEASSTE